MNWRPRAVPSYAYYTCIHLEELDNTTYYLRVTDAPVGTRAGCFPNVGAIEPDCSFSLRLGGSCPSYCYEAISSPSVNTDCGREMITDLCDSLILPLRRRRIEHQEDKEAGQEREG